MSLHLSHFVLETFLHFQSTFVCVYWGGGGGGGGGTKRETTEI